MEFVKKYVGTWKKIYKLIYDNEIKSKTDTVTMFYWCHFVVNPLL